MAERVERRYLRTPSLIALSGPYRYYDWGYEPFLLCDFHVHTQWSDGKLTVREVVDLYGQTGKFDVIAITDHILMKKDLLARAGRIATLGRCAFGVREQGFADYLADIESEGQRALKEYGMLVVPGADAILREIRRQGAQRRLPSVPHDDEADRDQHLLSLGSPRGAVISSRSPASSMPACNETVNFSDACDLDVWIAYNDPDRD